jgi:RNA polymerase sigma-70 factor (ECF subfamily)
MFRNDNTIREIPDFIHPGVELEQKENSKILFSAINKLNHQQKTAYILKNVQGLSYKKISDIMNKSISSIESLIYRAKQNLKTIIKKI